MSDHRAEFNAVEFAQMVKLKEEAEGFQKERGQSARDRQKQQQRDLKSSEVSAGSSRYAQLLSNNQRALSGRAKRLSPSGKHVGVFMSTPDHNYATQKKQTISPNSIRKNLSNQQRPDLQHGQQQRSINNLRQNLMHGKQQSQHHSRDTQRRNDAGSQQMMRQLCLEEQIMDLEDKSHSGTLLDHEKAQGKKNRSRNYQLEIRTDPKLEPRSVQIELMNSGQPASGNPLQSSGNMKPKNKVFMKTQQQLVPSSMKSLSSPGSGRQVPLSSTKHVPSSNIFQLGTKGSKQKFNPKSTISDADLIGHKSQPSNSSLQWQPQTMLKQPPQQDGQTKKLPQSQVQSNYFVQKHEQEQSKEPTNKNKKRNIAGHIAQKDLQNLQTETPQDADRMSTLSGNVFDDTRNNGLNKAAIQDSSQHTQYLSTQGNGQLHFIHTPASIDTPDLHYPNRNPKDYPTHPYGGAPTSSMYQPLDTQTANNPQSPKNFGPPVSQPSPGRTSSKYSATHSSLYNRQLPRGSAIHYLVKEIPAQNCDLCSLQRGLQEIDKALKDRDDRLAAEAETLSGRGNDSLRYQPSLRASKGYKQSSARVKKKEEFREQREQDPDWGSIAAEPVRLSASKFMIREVLGSKYLECDDYFNCKLTSDIMYNETRHIVSVFKDYLIYDDFSEYMKRFYRHDEATERLPRIFSFYAKYSKVYPNYVALPRESRFMFKNIERKQKLIDQRNRRMQEVQEKKAAAERGVKDVEGLFGDRGGDGSGSKSAAKFNLFNSEFVNNLTDHEFLKQRQANAAFNEMHDDNIQETLGFDGPQGSDHLTDNKFQVFQASVGNRDLTQRSAVDQINVSNRLSQLLMDISMVSRAEQSSLPTRSQVMNRGTSSKMSHPLAQSRQPGLLDQSEHPRPESQPFAQVPSISCSFISNQQSASKVIGPRSAVDDPRVRNGIQGFDLNATSGDSLKQHFKNEDNLAEITSILYTDGNTNDDKKRLPGDDDEAEFAVPSEKDDEIVSAAEPPPEKQKHSKQKSGRAKETETKLQSQKITSLPGSNEQSAKRSIIKTTNKDKKSSAGRTGSNTAGTKSGGGRSHRDEPRVVTKTTSSIIGQAMKNQELLWQAQRASMLKHAIQEVERDAQQRQMMPEMDLPLPVITTEGQSEDCIDDEFERNVGQSEDFQNFLNKYMQQKLRQAEQKVKDNFLELEQCEYGPSPQQSLAQQQAQAQATANQLSAFKPLNNGAQHRSKSGERSGSRGSRASLLSKTRSQKKTFVKPSKYTPSGIGATDQKNGPHPLRSASDATLMKDVSTGQLLKKLNSNYVPMERIYGAGALTKKRKTLSTPKHRPSAKKNLTRTGSRSSRAEERLAQLGFPKYPLSKKQSQKQSKIVDHDGDDDEELPSVDDEYQGLGKNMQERQHQNHQALQRETSNRKVPSVAESPGSRLDRNSQMLHQLPLHQNIVNTTGNMPSPNSDAEKNKTLERAEGREQQPPKVPMKTKKLSELQMLSQGSLKDPSKGMVTKHEPIQIPNIAQMKLVSNPGSIKSSILQTKPSSSRKLHRQESPGSTQKNLMGGIQSKRDKISVYPTQRVQTMKGAGDTHVRKPQGSIYASSEMYLNTDRPTATHKQPVDKSNLSQPRKGANRGIQCIPGSTKQVEKMNSHGAFGPRADQHHPNKTVKTDRASSANLKIPGSTINLKVDQAAQQHEYNHALDAIKIKPEPLHHQKEKVTPNPKSHFRGTVSSPYIAAQIQRKRGSAAATLKSYRPNSLTDSARGTSTNSGPGIYAKMIRAQAQTSVKQRQIASSSSSQRANYTTRTKQQSSQQIRTGSIRPDSVSSQKDNKIQQFRTKSGCLASASLLSPSLLQSSHQQSLPSQKIIGNRLLEQKQQRTSSRGTPITNPGGLKKQSMKTITSGKGQASFGPASKRLSKKQTIFSVNTSEQR